MMPTKDKHYMYDSFVYVLPVWKEKNNSKVRSLPFQRATGFSNRRVSMANLECVRVLTFIPRIQMGR